MSKYFIFVTLCDEVLSAHGFAEWLLAKSVQVKLVNQLFYAPTLCIGLVF